MHLLSYSPQTVMARLLLVIFLVCVDLARGFSTESIPSGSGSHGGSQGLHASAAAKLSQHGAQFVQIPESDSSSPPHIQSGTHRLDGSQLIHHQQVLLHDGSSHHTQVGQPYHVPQQLVDYYQEPYFFPYDEYDYQQHSVSPQDHPSSSAHQQSLHPSISAHQQSLGVQYYPQQLQQPQVYPSPYGYYSGNSLTSGYGYVPPFSYSFMTPFPYYASVNQGVRYTPSYNQVYSSDHTALPSTHGYYYTTTPSHEDHLKTGASAYTNINANVNGVMAQGHEKNPNSHTH